MPLLKITTSGFDGNKTKSRTIKIKDVSWGKLTFVDNNGQFHDLPIVSSEPATSMRIKSIVIE